MREAEQNFKAETMKNFELKTHRLESRYEKPHFFILNKGQNSGKPLKEPCANCYTCMVENVEDKDFMFWLCYGLWRSGSFHYYLKGSVVLFITIGDMKKHIQKNANIAVQRNGAFLNTIATYKLLDENEQRLLKSLNLIDQARKVIYYKFINS